MDSPDPKSSRLRALLITVACAGLVLVGVIALRNYVRSGSPLPPPQLRLGATKTLGGVEFSPLELGLREVSGKTVMALRARIKNVTGGEFFAPIDPDFCAWSRVHDNFANEWDAEACTDEAGGGIRRLQPGESLTAVLTAAPPVVENAADFVWTVRLTTSNQQGHASVEVSFGRSEIQPLKREVASDAPKPPPAVTPPPSTVPPQPPQDSPALRPEEASRHVDETVCVEYVVVEVGYSSKSDTTFLNFLPHRQGSTEFTAVVFSKQRESFEHALGGELKKVLEGKRIRVKGKVQLYKDAPEIILESPDQLTVVK